MRKTVMTVAMAVFVCSLSFAQQQDFSKVEVKAEKVAGNVYMLTGSGGNIAVMAGDDGVVMVDAEYAPLADKIRAAVKTISDKPVRFLINTHWHGDHTSGNVAFGDSATIIAHDNVRNWLGTEQKSVFGQAIPPLPKAGLPVITYDKQMSLHMNGEDILLVHPANSHTDGDTVVWFGTSHVAHMGDNFVNGRFPILDVPHGGSVAGMIAVDERTLSLAPPDAKYIPGHGPVATRADLQNYVAMLKETRDAVLAGIQKGRSADQLKADHVLQKYEATLGNPDRYIDFLYADLSRTTAAGK